MSKNAKFELGKRYDSSFEGLSPQEVRDNLDGLAYAKKEETYTKNLTNDELAVAKSEFAEVGLDIADIEERKKEAMDDFKHELKEPIQKKKELIEMIKHKSVRKQGILWLVDDQEEGYMYSFDENGICVDERRLLPTERQTRMRTIGKEISNG